MKQRIISGAIIAAITIAAIVVGSWFFFALCLFISVWGSYEFLSSRGKKINWVEFALMLLFIILLNNFYDKAIPLVLGLLVCLFTLSVFDKEVSFDDICATFIESVLLGFAVYYMNLIEHTNKMMFGYIVIIAYLTDVFALFTGMKFGKHKLNERISPKKTIEGAIGGYIAGASISFIFAAIFKFFDLGVLRILVASLLLPAVSQVGDLAFSLIKRHYGVKDFSKLIPGHGGLLDRLDSLSFVLVIFGAILSFL